MAAANWVPLERDGSPNWALLERTVAPVAPTITTLALPTGRVGVAYSQVIQATGSPAPTAAITAGALPGGLALAGVSRQISGAPTVPVLAEFEVTVSNSAGSDVKALSILVPNEGVGSELPVVTTVTLVPAAAGMQITDTVDLLLTVEDQVGAPISNLGAALEVQGVAVTAEQLQPTDTLGQATVRVTGLAPGSAEIVAVVDGVRSNTSNVTVISTPVAPTIATTQLPSATLGVPYHQVLNATGSEPITWSIVAGALPTGLALLDGAISGMPTVPGPSSFTVQASNVAGFAQQALALAVASDNEGPTDILLSPSSVLEGAQNGTVVGTFLTVDPDQGSGHNYTLLDNAGGRFAISGAQLVIANGSLLDFEAATYHSITVRTTDVGGLTLDKAFVIVLIDQSETTAVFTALEYSTLPITGGVAAQSQLVVTARDQFGQPLGGVSIAALIANAAVALVTPNVAVTTAQGNVTLNVQLLAVGSTALSFQASHLGVILGDEPGELVSIPILVLPAFTAEQIASLFASTVDPKYREEVLPYPLDFRPLLVAGESLVSPPLVMEVEPYGDDALDPAADDMMIGPPIVTSSAVIQYLRDGKPGIQYILRARCATSLGRTLVAELRLRVYATPGRRANLL